MKLRKSTLNTALALILIAVLLFVFLLPEAGTDAEPDHNCSGEHCILCLASALAPRTVERLTAVLWAVLLSALLAVLSVRLFESEDLYTARYTPVFLKVKLLN